MPTTVISTPTTISVDTTIAADVTTEFTGTGSYSVDSGKVLTILGPIEAPARQIFSGLGTVKLHSAPLAFLPVQWFGLLGDNSTDNADAWDRLTAALPSAPTFGEGGYVVFPPGLYRFSRSMLVPRGMNIRGTGGGGPFYGENTCALLFPTGVTGIRVEKYFPTGDPGAVPPLPAIIAQGDYSVISDLTVKALGKSAASPADGIVLRAPCELNSVFVTGFARHGIWCDGADTVNYNANPAQSRLYRCRVWDCGCTDNSHPSGYIFGVITLVGHGILIEGGEGSLVIVDQSDCRRCTGAGIYDNGSYGNLYLSPHATVNRGGGFNTGPQSGFNRSLFLGAYREGDPEDFFLPSNFEGSVGPIILGGHHTGQSTGVADYLTGQVWRLKTPLSLGFSLEDVPEADYYAGLSISHGNAGGGFLEDHSDKNIAGFFQAYPGEPGVTCGVFGLGKGTQANASIGVCGRGIQESALGTTTGGRFEAVTPGVGATAYGVYAEASGPGTNWAGHFEGRVNVTDSLTVDGFRFAVQAGQLVVIAPDDTVTIITGVGAGGGGGALSRRIIFGRQILPVSSGTVH
jgi:hypothetical protein